MNILLRRIVLIGLCIVPFIPLIIAEGISAQNFNFFSLFNLLFPVNLFFPFITGKAFLFRIVIEIIFGAWLILAWRDPAYRPRRTRLFIAVTAFILMIGVADMFGANPHKSFWSNFERMEGYVMLLHLWAYFVMLATTLRSEKLWTRLFTISLGVSLLEVLYGLLQLAGLIDIRQGGVRLDGTFGNATYLAIYAVFHIFLAAILWYRSRINTTTWQWFYLSALVLNTVMLYYTATRGAILGLLAGLFLGGVLIAWRGEGRLRRAALSVVALIVGLVIVFMMMRATPLVQNSPILRRFADISVSERTTSSRFMVWNMAWQGFKERPVLGWGQENFNIVFNKYYDPKMYMQEQWFDRAHNVFFDWLIAGGSIGLALYISLFVFALLYIWKSHFSVVEKSLLTAMFAAYFVHIIFVFDNLGSQLLFFSMLAYLQHQAETLLPAREKTSVSKEGMAIVVPLVIIAVLVSLYTVNFKHIAASRNLVKTLYPLPVAQKLALYQDIVKSGTFALPEVREQMVQQALGAAGDTTASEEVRNQFVTFAAEQMAEQLKETPEDARYHFFYGSFLLNLNHPDEALVNFQNALKLSPNKQAIRFYVGQVYIVQGKYKEALSTFKETFELEPNYTEARKYYAGALIYNGQDEAAAEILKPVYGAEVPAEPIFISAYTATKQYDKLIKLWQSKIKAEPKNKDHHLSLAAAYYFSGNPARAITEVENAVVIDPAFRSQANFLIQEIRAGRIKR